MDQSWTETALLLLNDEEIGLNENFDPILPTPLPPHFHVPTCQLSQNLAYNVKWDQRIWTTRKGPDALRPKRKTSKKRAVNQPEISE
jgi:hypothetical protein